MSSIKNHLPKDHPMLHPLHGILLVNLGTPADTSKWSIACYLAKFLSDHRVINLPRLFWLPLLYGVIIPLRLRSLQRIYQGLATDRGLPLRYLTNDLADDLAKALQEDAKTLPGTEVRAVMRYGEPAIRTILDDWLARGLQTLHVLPLFPQYAQATTASVYDEIFRCFKRHVRLPTLKIVSHYGDHPAYIAAIADSIRAFQADHGQPEVLLFSYHGLPAKSLTGGDPYHCYCCKTTRLVAEVLDLSADSYRHAFQSRFGREPWLQPYTDDVLDQLVADGVKRIQIVCPGFSIDCSETLDEVAKGYCQRFLRQGGESAQYIPALNASPGAVQMLSELLKQDF